MPSLVEGLNDTLCRLARRHAIPALDDDWPPATSHDEHDDQLGHNVSPSALTILHFLSIWVNVSARLCWYGVLVRSADKGIVGCPSLTDSSTLMLHEHNHNADSSRPHPQRWRFKKRLSGEQTSPGPWDASADVEVSVDEVLAELEAVAKMVSDR
jgi:hypothetical protein